MRKIEEPRSQILRRSCFAQRSGRGDHRIQKGQSQADTGSLQECPAGQVLLSQEHGPNRSAETYWKSSSGGCHLNAREIGFCKVTGLRPGRKRHPNKMLAKMVCIGLKRAYT